MTNIEKMKRYIELTQMPDLDRYCMCMDDLHGLHDMLEQGEFSALALAFEFGQAKGYRAAKAEVRA